MDMYSYLGSYGDVNTHPRRTFTRRFATLLPPIILADVITYPCPNPDVGSAIRWAGV